MNTKCPFKLAIAASGYARSRMGALWRTLLLSSLALSAISYASAQTHMLYYDPNESGGTGFGGSGFWYQGAPGNWNPWWNGSSDASWDGNSSVSLQGTTGTLTLDAEVDCGPNAQDASPSLNAHINYTLDLNGKTLNFNDQWGEVGIFTDPGVTLQIAGAANWMHTVLNWQDGGIVQYGNGQALTNNQFGTGIFRGFGRVDNDPSGAAAFAWYVALQGGNCDGVGALSAPGALVEMSTVPYNDKVNPVLSPGIGSGTGTMILGQNLQEDDSTCILSFNLGGSNQGAVTNGYSWLAATNGTVNLYAGSTINVQLVNEYIPLNSTNSFDVITCKSFVGAVLSSINFNLPSVAGGFWSEAFVNNNGLQSLRLTLTTQGYGIEISEQPTNTIVSAGQSATFTVSALLMGPEAGAATLGYQWQSNGVSILGANSAVYTTPAATGWANKAVYTCKLTAAITTNAIQVTTSKATLTVVSQQNYASLWLPFNGRLNDQGISSFAPHSIAGQNVYGGTYGGSFSSDVANTTCGTDSLSLNGDASDIQVANAGDLNFNTGNPFTVSAWVKTTAGGTIWAYSTPNPIAAASGTHCIACYVGTGSLGDGEPQGAVVADIFWVGNNYSTRTVNDGNWHHVVVTFDGSGTVGIYIDGTADAVTHKYGYGAANENANNDAGTWNFTVGATLNYDYPTETGTDNPFTGAVDEVAVWPQVLTSTQISNVYNLGVDSPPPTPPTLYAGRNGNQLILSWSGSGWKVQQNTNLESASGWVDAFGGSTSPLPVNVGLGNLFFRLVQQ